jgi:hypothetical protein
VRGLMLRGVGRAGWRGMLRVGSGIESGLASASALGVCGCCWALAAALADRRWALVEWAALPAAACQRDDVRPSAARVLVRGDGLMGVCRCCCDLEDVG